MSCSPLVDRSVICAGFVSQQTYCWCRNFVSIELMLLATCQTGKTPLPFPCLHADLMSEPRVTRGNSLIALYGHYFNSGGVGGLPLTLIHCRAVYSVCSINGQKEQVLQQRLVMAKTYCNRCIYRLGMMDSIRASE